LSIRLEELLGRAQHQQSPLPPELIDEIAFTTGELMLVLTNHVLPEEESVQEALAHARKLRERLRIDQPLGNRMTEECINFSREITQLLRDSKRAA
jgi:hypothetical protein